MTPSHVGTKPGSFVRPRTTAADVVRIRIPPPAQKRRKTNGATAAVRRSIQARPARAIRVGNRNAGTAAILETSAPHGGAPFCISLFLPLASWGFPSPWRDSERGRRKRKEGTRALESYEWAERAKPTCAAKKFASSTRRGKQGRNSATKEATGNACRGRGSDTV